MQSIFEINANRRTPKYQQIINSVTKAIKEGRYKKGDRIFSINELSSECLLSRDTVQRAYELLEKEMIIEAVKGKGYYIRRTDIVTPYRVLLVFNKLSNYKKMIYDSFVRTLGRKATVELKIHHSSIKLLDEMIDPARAEYDYYVIMPHFYDHPERLAAILSRIPHEKLLLLDKDVASPGNGYCGVFQDFENDIIEALEQGISALRKYKKLIYVHPFITPYPLEIRAGFMKFCKRHRFAHDVVGDINPQSEIRRGEVYVVIEETDLVNLIRVCRIKNLVVGKDVGIISYNETPLKNLLLDGITVVSTDHYKMGEAAAQMLLSKNTGRIKNPFTLIIRNSL